MRAWRARSTRRSNTRCCATFDVSIDFLLLEKAPRRALHAPQSKLVQRILEIGPLSGDDEKSLLHMLEAIEAKNKLKALAAKVG